MEARVRTGWGGGLNCSVILDSGLAIKIERYRDRKIESSLGFGLHTPRMS